MLGESLALKDEYDNLEEMQEIEDLKTRWCLQSRFFGISQRVMKLVKALEKVSRCYQVRWART